MSGRVRLGIVGFDHPHVLRFAPMLAAHPGVDLVWIASDGPNRAAAEAMAGRLGTRFVAEPAGGIDAAYLAVRPGRHLEVVSRLAPEGVHLLCDKPIALTAEDGRAIVETARAAGVRLMVPFNPRGQLGPRAVKERIDEGALGEVRLVHVVKVGKVPLTIPGIDASWLLDPVEAGFGGFGDIGMHAVDALRWLLGREASARPRSSGRVARSPPSRRAGSIPRASRRSSTPASRSSGRRPRPESVIRTRISGCRTRSGRSGSPSRGRTRSGTWMSSSSRSATMSSRRSRARTASGRSS
jgi:predicted dehydrogenase